ncbi:MAG: divergent polysaccharide deacetylase family protein [Candidatus Latescibacterota bacterium]
MGFRLDRLFGTKRQLYLCGGIFVLLGTLAVGYFGSLARNNMEEGRNHRVVEVKAHKKALKNSKALTGSRAKVRAYAFSTPGVAPKVQVSTSTAIPGSRPSLPVALEKASLDAPTEGRNAQPGALYPSSQVVEPETLSAVVIVIDDLGIDQIRTKKVIELAGPLTLAFLPYGYNLKTLTSRAIVKNHELLVHLPMQPHAENADPGPNALLRTLSEIEIRRRIDWNLSQFAGFVGINNHMGSNFTTWESGMSFVMQEMKTRGLLYLDSLTSPKSVAKKVAREYGLSILSRDIFLDNEPELDQIRSRLLELEEISRRRGYAIGIGHPYDKTIEALSEWSKDLNNRGLKLVALSQLFSN